MYNNFSNDIKNRLDTVQVFEFYGLHLNNANYVCCPFHNEKTPSMKIYSGSRGFYCFGCGMSGSVIDFVMQYFNLNFQEAITKLNDDFNLGLPIGEKLDRRKRLEMARKAFNANREQKNKQQERDKFLNNYHIALDKFIRLDKNKIKYKPKSLNEELHPLFIEAIMELPHQKHRIECAKMELYKYETRNSNNT